MNETPTDLSGVDLLLASPCGSGRYERVYVKSLLRSFIGLTRWGAKFDWADMPYCADLALARAKIFGTFLRSNHTHLMCVDDDMGWSPVDIARLLQVKRDFVVGIGVKKTDPYGPLQFCFSMGEAVTLDADERLPLRVERHTGLLEVDKVGAAFILITKAVAERMSEAYSSLSFYDDATSILEFAVFDPLIIDKRRLSEDYSFCHRWREIGGHIHAIPDIRLKHVGPYTWEAALTDTMAEQGHGELKNVA